MDTSAQYGGTFGSRYTLNIAATEISVDTPSNTSVVEVSVYMYTSNNAGYHSATGQSGYLIIDGTTYDFSGPYVAENGAQYFVSNQTQTIAHNNDGTRTINISAYHNADNASGLTTASASGNMTLTNIQRTANITTFSLGSPTLTGFTITADVDQSCSQIEYFINGSGTVVSGDETGWVIPVTGLSPDTLYSVYVIVTQAASGLTTTSSTQTITTLTSSSGFFIGDM